jgi:uncharacterized coiled-coil DUF342 family protein
MDELSKAYSQAQELAFERLETLSVYEKELPYAQALARERMETIEDLAEQKKQLVEQKKQLAEQKSQLTEQKVTLLDERKQLKDQVVALMNHPGYKAYEKAKRILIKMKILRAHT